MYQSTGNNRKATGVLLVGHGTRDAIGRSEFLETSMRVAQQVTMDVEPCFLELSSPTIGEALNQLVDRGCQQIVACPLLLFAAGHAKYDIPRVLRAVAPGHVALRQTRHLGCDSRLVDLSVRRYHEALAAGADQPSLQTLAIMVGRGSHDAVATAEMHKFVGLRLAAAPVDHIECCFLAMASPRLEAVLQSVAEWGIDQVVVQPHLLFHGELIARIKKLVENEARKNKTMQWLVTGHLGPHVLLVDAIVDRINEVMDI